MEPRQIHRDGAQAENTGRHGFVLVRDAVVIAHFGPGQAQAAADTAYRLTERDGKHIDVYEVDRRLPPPEVGQRVDADALGWTDVN